ncbi:MAG: hypothetical protein U1G08_15230 [Verrucomicrobiota bacterium]
MGCTIDHLGSDQRVRVLAQFRDLSGIEVQAGDTGVIRRLEADFIQELIAIEWERNDRPERLTFALRSRTGPGNGRMRQYFEDLGPEPPPIPPKAAAPPPAPPTPPPPPAGGNSLGERTVACACDPAFYRPVISESVGVNACLRCGTVTATRAVGDDGRYTGDAWTAYLPLEIPEDHLSWLARWPRIRVIHRHILWPMAAELVREEVVYLPATRRFRSVEDLTRFEADRKADAAKTPRGLRLRDAGTPSAPPPKDLATLFAEFHVLWDSLQLRANQPLPELIRYSQRRCPGRFVASELILERRDRLPIVLDALRSPDSEWQSAGHVLALALQPTPPEVITTALELLEGIPMLPSADVPGRIAAYGRFESLVLLLAELRTRDPEVIAVLQRLLRKVVRHDANLVDPIRTALRILRGESPAPLSFLP